MTQLPPWEHWQGDEGWEPLANLETALDQNVIAALSVGRSSRGYQVSVRRNTDGWEVYYGTDLADAIARAVMGGPQNPVTKPVELAPWQEPVNLASLFDNINTDNGVQYAFDSEGITPL